MTYEVARYSKSRFYRRFLSGSGKFTGMKGATSALRSMSSTFRRKALGRYDETPFVPYSVLPALDRIAFEANVLEVGAGMSTCWLAQRAARLASFEWNDAWADEVARIAHRRGLTNLKLTKCTGHELMGFEEIEDNSLDLAFIDGGPRSLCLRNLMPKVKPGGFLYLDNWDVDLFWTEGGIDARKIVEDLPHENLELHVDYTPQYFSVSEGLLIHMPHSL